MKKSQVKYFFRHHPATAGRCPGTFASISSLNNQRKLEFDQEKSMLGMNLTVPEGSTSQATHLDQSGFLRIGGHLCCNFKYLFSFSRTIRWCSPNIQFPACQYNKKKFENGTIFAWWHNNSYYFIFFDQSPSGW